MPITGMTKSLKNVDFVGFFEENLQKRSANVAKLQQIDLDRCRIPFSHLLRDMEIDALGDG